MNTVPIKQITESPFNKRDLGDLTELAQSIRTYGVLQPILLRPLNGSGKFECVFGHRRLRAAKAAGLEEIPAQSKELSDAEVIETQIIENVQRKDIHPFEEGAAYRELHERCGFSVDEIAAKVGRSTGTIYARMKLCSLCDTARKAVLEGKLDASIAVLIARIPSEKVQAEATKNLLEQTSEDEPISYRSAAEIVQSNYMTRLKDAPFDVKDAELVVEAGACSTCPKRSGAQPELFPEVARENICIDTVCFAAKRDATWKIRSHEAKAAGKTVLTEKEAKAIFLYGSDQPAYNCGLVDFDREDFAAGRKTTYRALAKKAGKELEVTLARDPRGGIHELVSRKAVDAIARSLRKDSEPETSAAANPAEEKWLREQDKKDIARTARAKAMVQIVDNIESSGANDAVWLALFNAAVMNAEVEDIAERRGLKAEDTSEKKKPNGAPALSPIAQALRGRYSIAGVPGRLGILLEMMVEPRFDENTVADLAEAYGIDLKKLESEVKAEQKAAAKAEGKGKKAAKQA